MTSDTTKARLSAAFAAIASVLTVLGGGALALVFRFRDFIIGYQLRPGVRPFYPLLFGAILGGAVAAAGIGVYALVLALKKSRARRPAGALELILSVNVLLVGAGMSGAITVLLRQAGYIAADSMYGLFLSGLLLCVFLPGAFGIAGIAGIASVIKKKPGSRAFRAVRRVPIVLGVMAAVVGGVVFLPPDVERAPFPDGLEFTALYARGDAGYDTFKIPTMIVAPDGTVLAFAEARTDTREDWSKTDVVVRRSADRGEAWSPLEVVLEDGRSVVGNACPVVDRRTGNIHLLFTKNNDTAYSTYSGDNGLTWARPEEITPDVKLPGWTWYAFGPANGIQLEDGTLVVPADHVEGRKKHAHAVFSRDGGATWALGGSIPGGDEAAIVQLDDGSLYINMRPVNGAGYRLTARSCDGGLRWTERAYDTALPDPMCQGSLIKVPRPGGGSVCLFTNPADRLHREKMTVRISEDGCRTWSRSKLLYEGLASYSALALLDAEAGLIGAFFERGGNYYAEEMVFTRFPLEWAAG